MSIEELLTELGIAGEAIENENGSYTVDIKDSNEFIKDCDLVERNGEDLDFEEDSEAGFIDSKVTTVQFVNDDFILTLMADWEYKEYKLVIRELN